MDFDLSDEQRLLKESVDRLILDRYQFQQRKQYMAEPAGFSTTMWQLFADQGLLGLPFLETLGGFGGASVETMIVAEAFGGLALGFPFSSCHSVLGALGFAFGSCPFLRGLLRGRPFSRGAFGCFPFCECRGMLGFAVGASPFSSGLLSGFPFGLGRGPLDGSG